jgi:heptosyltransferase-2
MTSMKNILIVKKGALGDVVRTSYFAGALKRSLSGSSRLHWLTAPSALPLLASNPHIDCVVTSVDGLRDEVFSCIYSLDDEMEILNEVASLRCDRIVGAHLKADGSAGYTPDSADWFDMGLLSRHGKARADELKKHNPNSHSEIFGRIFGVQDVQPEFFGGDQCNGFAASVACPDKILIGINPYAGGRWKSKELREAELSVLIRRLLAAGNKTAPVQILIFGAGEDYRRNVAIETALSDGRVKALNTDDSVLHLAGAIRALDLLITSDSFALHLAVAQRVPFVAFFSPTSAAEIDTFGLGQKVTSTSPDYCTYRSDVDNSSITADRLLHAASRLREAITSERVGHFLASLS